MRRLPTKKILIATLGVGAVSYAVGCLSDTSSSGNLMAPDSGADARDDVFVSSGNLMPPPPVDASDANTDGASEAGSDAGADAADAADDAPSDANDDGG